MIELELMLKEMISLIDTLDTTFIIFHLKGLFNGDWFQLDMNCLEVNYNMLIMSSYMGLCHHNSKVVVSKVLVCSTIHGGTINNMLGLFLQHVLCISLNYWCWCISTINQYRCHINYYVDTQLWTYQVRIKFPSCWLEKHVIYILLNKF